MSDPNTTVSLVTASKASALAGAMDDGEQNTEQSLMPEVSASTATVPLPTASSDRESRSEEERYPPTRCQRKRGSGICTSDHTGKVVDGRYYCDKCYELATRSTDSSSQLASAKSKLKAEKLKADKLSKDLKAAQRALAKLKVRADSDEPSEEEKRAKKSRRSARVEAAAAVKSSPKKVIRKGHGKYEVKDSSSSESAKDSSDFSRKSPKKKSKASKHLKKAKSTKKVTFQDRTNNKKKSAQKKTIAREKQEYRELKATLDAQQDEVERLQDKPQPSSPKKRRKRSARIHRAERTRDKLAEPAAIGHSPLQTAARTRLEHVGVLRRLLSIIHHHQRDLFGGGGGSGAAPPRPLPPASRGASPERVVTPSTTSPAAGVQRIFVAVCLPPPRCCRCQRKKRARAEAQHHHQAAQVEPKQRQCQQRRQRAGATAQQQAHDKRR